MGYYPVVRSFVLRVLHYSRGLHHNTDRAEHYNIVVDNGEKTYKVRSAK